MHDARVRKKVRLEGEQRGRENPGEVTGPRPHGPAGDDDEKEEKRRHRRARAGGLSRDGRFVLLMFLAALALRLAPFPAATSRGWRLLSPDCYGHLRR